MTPRHLPAAEETAGLRPAAVAIMGAVEKNVGDAAQRQEVYRFRIPLILKFIWAILRGRTRDLAADVEATLMGARPQPRVLNADCIPLEGPFVLVANHYERPGLKVFWGGMLVSHAVFQRRTAARSLRWLMTSEWYNYRLGPIPVPVSVLRWLFRRIGRVYGLVIVPRAAERGVGRAAALRSILDVVRGQGEAIALFPEAVGTGRLIQPAPGVGQFLLLLSRRRIPILPVGIFEQEDRLTAAFGPPFSIELPADVAKEERERRAAEQVMVSIGRLLPPDLRGFYAEPIAQALALEDAGRER
jgi:1-acyl-sn-glycerol-3-phosphate acyltransferase